MTLQRVVSLVTDELGWASSDMAEESTREVLGALGEIMASVHAHRLRGLLGHPLTEWLGTPLDDPREVEGPEWLSRVVLRLGGAPGRARERAMVTCQALGRALPPTALQCMEACVAPSVVQLFIPQERGAPLSAHAHPVRAQKGRNTLSGGRPGSDNPLSEGASVHANSVSASEDPRGHSRLSSARPGADGRTLAGGRPKSRRPVVDEG